MKRIGFLYERIISLDNCREAIIKASKGKTHRKYVSEILENLEYYAQDLSLRLQTDTFTTPYKHRVIQDGLSHKKRDLEIPSFYPDQCAHHALIQVLKPIVMKSAYYWSCGNIKGRGIKRACIGVDRATKRHPKKAKYCFKADIKKFYPNVNHDVLKEALARKIKDKKALALYYRIIDTHPNGIPIGNYTSPWFAEFILQSLDHFIKEQCHIKFYIRYADDIVLIDSKKRKLHKAVKGIMELLNRFKFKLKENWQVFKIYRNGKGRKIDFVGNCFAIGFTTIRKTKALAFIRQARRILKRQKNGTPVSLKMAEGFISRSACLKRTDSFSLSKKYYCPIDIFNLKEVIRHASSRGFITTNCGITVGV